MQPTSARADGSATSAHSSSSNRVRWGADASLLLRPRSSVCSRACSISSKAPARMFSTPYGTRRCLSGTFPSYYHLAMYGWFGPPGDGHVATKWGSSGGAQTAAGGRTTRAIRPGAASSNTRVPPCKWLIAVTIAILDHCPAGHGLSEAIADVAGGIRIVLDQETPHSNTRLEKDIAEPSRRQRFQKDSRSLG